MEAVAVGIITLKRQMPEVKEKKSCIKKQQEEEDGKRKEAETWTVQKKMTCQEFEAPLYYTLLCSALSLFIT